MYSVEAFALDGSIRAERHVEPIALCDDGVGQRSRRAAVAANQRRRRVVAVENFDAVVRAIQMSFQLKVAESLQRKRKGAVIQR